MCATLALTRRTRRWREVAAVPHLRFDQGSVISLPDCDLPPRGITRWRGVYCDVPPRLETASVVPLLVHLLVFWLSACSGATSLGPHDETCLTGTFAFDTWSHSASAILAGGAAEVLRWNVAMGPAKRPRCGRHYQSYSRLQVSSISYIPTWPN